MEALVERTIVLLADGARADVIDELATQGKLPNISAHIIEPGAKLDAVTVFPSTTGPAYFPFLTGCTPGACNVPGIRWFDKTKFKGLGWPAGHRSYVGLESFLLGSDISAGVPSIFEIVPNSYNIFNAITKGVGRRNLTKFSRIWYWYYAHLTDRWAFVDKAALEKTLQALEQDLQYLFVVFPGIDEYSHLAHPHHQSTYDSYAFLDEAVGQIVAKLKDKNQWENTSLWIVSDHGLSKTDQHFCLNTFLEKHDLPPFFYPEIFNRKGKKASTMVSGNGMAHLSFKNHDGWSRMTTRSELEKNSPGLLADLVSQAAIDIVLCRNAAGGVDVLSKRGEAKVKLTGNTISYDVIGSDPFAYNKLPPQFDSKTCFAETWHSDYPDAPYQLAQLFHAARTGDVVVSATPGYDLRLKYEHPEHRGSHGSLHASHMKVPLLCNRPFTRNWARTTDTFPTILNHLGLPIPASIDGEVLS